IPRPCAVSARRSRTRSTAFVHEGGPRSINRESGCNPRPLAQRCRRQIAGGAMAKQGRPLTRGIQPGWMLQREMLALFAYDRARRTGLKHSASVTEAVNCQAVLRVSAVLRPLAERCQRCFSVTLKARKLERGATMAEGAALAQLRGAEET